MDLASVTSKIVEIDSSKAGPTLAVFAGAHGNELAGVYALLELIPRLKVTRGKLLLAFANPPAIEANVRMINKNLNRCYLPNNDGITPEDSRARELMKVLDKSDALLDLHMFYDDAGLPFAICEDNALDLADKFEVDIISTNWDPVEPGASDWYMFKQNKIGVCVECGPISKAKEYKEYATKCIYQFLKYFDMTDQPVEFSSKAKRIIVAQRAIHKPSTTFQLEKNLHNFDRLKPGQVIATDGGKQYIAKDGECIIFPHYKARIGEEAYIIAIEK
jgi:succinylglutamate desuccinylase